MLYVSEVKSFGKLLSKSFFFSPGTLQKLDVSHNHIEFIIAPEYWDCPSLTDLNLSNNQLGLAQNRKALLEFPTNSLVCLNLSDNNLCQLPLSVCYMSNLASLDISRYDECFDVMMTIMMSRK